MTRSRARFGRLLLAALVAAALTPAAPSAQRRGRPDNSVFGIPVATRMLLEHPDDYYGKVVTLSAGVEAMLSKTAFLVDQHKAAGPSEVRPLGMPVLVIAPFLTRPLEGRTYVLVRGQVVKFEPSVVERAASGYTLDLAADVGARYLGQPVLVATSVLDSSYSELTKEASPPAARDEP